jgi:hypothetical protein
MGGRSGSQLGLEPALVEMFCVLGDFATGWVSRQSGDEPSPESFRRFGCAGEYLHSKGGIGTHPFIPSEEGKWETGWLWGRCSDMLTE